MELLKGNVKALYFRYLSAAFGSALVSSIYSLVDSIIIGQYEGPTGAAALATVAPVWNIIYSLGLLFGIGGSVLMSTSRGAGDRRQGDRYFTATLIGITVTTLLAWSAILLLEAPMLRLFGADDVLLPKAQAYLKWIRLTVPLFLFSPFLAAFLRNDGVPVRATAAVLAGGAFNVVGDWYFVFGLDMGIEGAGLATALGQLLTILILCGHFLSSRCTLRLAAPQPLCADLRLIVRTGFSSFFIDIAMGILSMLFNNQIMRYSGSAALAVYGLIINISTFAQSCAYGIGQAAQPLISTNFGARRRERVLGTLKLALATCGIFGAVETALTLAFPIPLVRAFMDATPEVLAIAPGIIRAYCISFLLLSYNVFSTYYFQSILRPRASFAISVLRGCLLSGSLILVFPAWLGGDALWWAMPVTELVIAVLVTILIRRYTARMRAHEATAAM